MNWIEPMEPISRDDVVKGDEWFHEIKWDGIRGLMYVSNGSVRIFTRKGKERTGYYPELDELPKLLEAREAIIDGEIVVLDESSRPSFHLSLIRERLRDDRRIRHYSTLYPAKYVAFDILYKDGTDLTGMPVEHRKEILRKSLQNSPTIAITDQFENGEALFNLMKEKDWEGIVSKKYGSAYVSGKKHRYWYKTKFYKKMSTYVGGIQWKNGLPNSLLLGVKGADGLIFVGKVSSGFNQRLLEILKLNAAVFQTDRCPFTLESIAGLTGDISWLKPALTCWVSFMELTENGHMRHPRILNIGDGSQKLELV